MEKISDRETDQKKEKKNTHTHTYKTGRNTGKNKNQSFFLLNKIICTNFRHIYNF